MRISREWLVREKERKAYVVERLTKRLTESVGSSERTLAIGRFGMAVYVSLDLTLKINIIKK